MQRAEEIGHIFPNQGGFDRGTPGLSKASHAEVQLIVGKPNANNIQIAPKAMCKSCHDFFQKEARHQGRPITVIDATGRVTFNGDGTVTPPRY
ncbi:MAG: hypothetical protein U7126_29650 [Microcoleus sp.]